MVDDALARRHGRRRRAARRRDERVRCIRNPYPNGFGFAVRAGLEAFTGDAVAIVMADGSDDPDDLVLYYRVLEAGYDCAFGSRFMPGATVTTTRVPSSSSTGSSTSASACSSGTATTTRRTRSRPTGARSSTTIEPLLSPHFNLTVEMPLKAIVRGFSYAIVPTSWRNRTAGESKLALKEMGTRYLFIVLYVFLEHHLSRGDYRRPGTARRLRRAQRRELSATRGQEIAPVAASTITSVPTTRR